MTHVYGTVVFRLDSLRRIVFLPTSCRSVGMVLFRGALVQFIFRASFLLSVLGRMVVETHADRRPPAADVTRGDDDEESFELILQPPPAG
ncbi:unspecific monooxygenase [Anopheles sinensis]|uniref:Unspecific monooxygenase n=1 Tax=Anopheles sinensis TaxID=74873 RepID=A0A084VMT7_ANOSI|nr:unspecific monooxygenase [Anopheles sinensis]